MYSEQCDLSYKDDSPLSLSLLESERIQPKGWASSICRNTMAEFNIVELIENQPIDRLTDTYNVKLLDNIKEEFSNADQKLFIGHFYGYLNYNKKTDYVVDLDDVWKWLEFNQKVRAQEVLERHFTVNVDYKHVTSSIEQCAEEKKGRGGRNIKKIMMTVNCFKFFCLKAQTKKAYEIHEYYMNLEEIFYKIMVEQNIHMDQKIKEQQYEIEKKKEETVKTFTEIEKKKEDARQIFAPSIAENERLRLEHEQLRAQIILQEILKTNQLLLQKVQTLESTVKDMSNRMNAMQTKTTTVCSQPDPHLGPRLQKIHPETLQILHVYETVTECMKEDHAMKRPSINKAVREHTIYHGFRWQLIDRELDPHTAHTLAPTKATKQQKNGYVAKVNQEQTEILHVYLDRKTAAQENNYPSIASLDNAVKNHTIKDGHYYQLYEECDDLKIRFQEKHGTIVLYHDGIGQYDSQHTLIAEFTSRFECTARAGISQKSLAKVLDHPILYKEWYFKSLGEKRFV